jgi:ABC-2 type transport system ATP-binding protein
VGFDRVAKRFGARRALDAVSFTVAAGEIVALLGPNGAGKSTAFALMLGHLRPDGGAVRLHGADPWR